MNNQKIHKLLISMIFTFISVLCLITVTFAWMTINNPVNSDNLLAQTSDKSISCEVYVIKNNKDLTNATKFETTTELNTYLKDTKPNDFYSFKVVCNNNSNTTVNKISLSLSNISVNTLDSNNEESILNYFYLENVYNSLDETIILYPQENSQYTRGETKEVPVYSKFSALLSGSSINLFEQVISSNQVIFYFTLCLHYTSIVQGQDLKIGNITIKSE